MPGTDRDDLNLDPAWLRDLMDEYDFPPEDLVTLNRLSEVTGLSRAHIPRYVEACGVKMSRFRIDGRVQYCITKEQTRAVFEQLAQDGYLIKKQPPDGGR
jgi:hypothetical protein